MRIPDDRLTGRQYLAEVERGAEASRQKGVRLVNEREGGVSKERSRDGSGKKEMLTHKSNFFYITSSIQHYLP